MGLNPFSGVLWEYPYSWTHDGSKPQKQPRTQHTRHIYSYLCTIYQGAPSAKKRTEMGLNPFSGVLWDRREPFKQLWITLSGTMLLLLLLLLFTMYLIVEEILVYVNWLYALQGVFETKQTHLLLQNNLPITPRCCSCCSPCNYRKKWTWVMEKNMNVDWPESSHCREFLKLCTYSLEILHFTSPWPQIYDILRYKHRKSRLKLQKGG